MQSTTLPYVSPLPNAQPTQPTPPHPFQVLAPLPPHVPHHAQPARHHDTSSLAARHIEDQTASIDSAPSQPTDASRCVIEGYTLNGGEIFRSDGKKLHRLGRSHVDLVKHFDRHRGTPFTGAELKLYLCVEKENTVVVYMHDIRHLFNIQQTQNENGIVCWVMNESKKASSTTASTKPASLPAPHPDPLTAAIRAEAESLRNQVQDMVNTAADDIRKALANRCWDRLNQRVRRLSENIETFLTLQRDDHGSKMRSPISPAVQMLVDTMSTYKNTVVVAHMKAGCHHFGLGHFPLPLIRLLRCVPVNRSTIEVVASHKADLNSPAHRTPALRAVLVYLSWLEIPWIDMSKDELAKQSLAIDEEIQSLFELLHNAYEAAKRDERERAAIVSSLKEALVPEHCSLSMALRLKHTKSKPRSIANTLRASLEKLESDALQHRGAPYSLNPFETAPLAPGKDAKRKAGEAADGHVEKKARTVAGIEPTNPHETSTGDDAHLPQAYPIPFLPTTFTSAQRWDSEFSEWAVPDADQPPRPFSNTNANTGAQYSIHEPQTEEDMGWGAQEALANDWSDAFFNDDNR